MIVMFQIFTLLNLTETANDLFESLNITYV